MPNKVEVFTQELDKCFTILKQQLVLIKYMKGILSSDDYQVAKLQELDNLIAEINNNLNELSSINREQYDRLSESILVLERDLERADNELTGIHNIVSEYALNLKGSEPYIDLKTPDVKYSIVGTEEDGLYIYPMVNDVQKGYIQYYEYDSNSYGLHIALDEDNTSYMKLNTDGFEINSNGTFNYRVMSDDGGHMDIELGPIDMYLSNTDNDYSFGLSFDNYITVGFNGAVFSSYISYFESENDCTLEIFSDEVLSLKANELRYNGTNIFAYNEVQTEDVEITEELYRKIATTQRLKDNSGRIYTLIVDNDTMFQFMHYNPISDDYISCIIEKNAGPSDKHEITFVGTGLN